MQAPPHIGSIEYHTFIDLTAQAPAGGEVHKHRTALGAILLDRRPAVRLPPILACRGARAGGTCVRWGKLPQDVKRCRHRERDHTAANTEGTLRAGQRPSIHPAMPNRRNAASNAVRASTPAEEAKSHTSQITVPKINTDVPCFNTSIQAPGLGKWRIHKGWNVSST